jgi:hypothetical protein
VKAEHAHRAVTLFLCLLVIVVVALGLGTAVSLGAPPPPPGSPAEINQNILQQMQQILTGTAPTVTDVNPNGGLTAGGTEVVITGTAFTGVSAVTFGGTPATVYTFVSDTQITATAPARAAGTVQVQVTTAAGASLDTSADDYSYVAAPPTTATPTTAAPTPTTATPTPTTAAPTATTLMVTTTVVATDGEGGGISGGWIAFIVVIALIALAALGAMVYMLGKSKKGGPVA